jgi:hypothetical protein
MCAKSTPNPVELHSLLPADIFCIPRTTTQVVSGGRTSENNQTTKQPNKKQKPTVCEQENSNGAGRSRTFVIEDQITEQTWFFFKLTHCTPIAGKGREGGGRGRRQCHLCTTTTTFTCFRLFRVFSSCLIFLVKIQVLR